MNDLKKMTVFMLLVVTFALSACIKDDSEDYTFVPLSQAEKTMQINNMQGTYNGCAFYNINTGNWTIGDSIKTSWTITANDSTLSIKNFPMKVFASNVVNSQLKEALLNDSVHTLNARIYLYRPWGTTGTLSYSYFNCIPYSTEDLCAVIPLIIDNEEKNVTFVFDTSFYTSFYANGVFDNKKDLSFNLILKEIQIENGSHFMATTLVMFYGYKQ